MSSSDPIVSDYLFFHKTSEWLILFMWGKLIQLLQVVIKQYCLENRNIKFKLELNGFKNPMQMLH